MAAGPTDPQWHRLLSLSVHEFRTPITVVAGYVRMLLKDRAGPLSPEQRRLLEETEKSCGRLSALIAEMSDLSNLEAGIVTLNRGNVVVSSLVSEAIVSLPPLPDREIPIVVDVAADGKIVQADPVRLRNAFASVLGALRREVGSADRLVVRVRPHRDSGRRAVRIAVADADHIDLVEAADGSAAGVFDEWRGGCGLSLAIARRIIDRHDGSISSPLPKTKTSAVIVLPVE